MPKLPKNLTSKEINRIKTPGTTKAIGHIPGLCLVVTTKGIRYYKLRYRFKMKSYSCTIGNADIITLPTAKKQALKYARMVAEDINPAEWKRGQKQPVILHVNAKHPLYRVSDEYLEFRQESGAFIHSDKGRKDYASMMVRYVYPTLQHKDVSDIDSNDILAVLQQVWVEKPALSVKLKRSIKGCLDYAILKGYRTDSNPCDMNGSLGVVLKSMNNKRKETSHHPALSYKLLPTLIFCLFQKHTPGAYALIFSILTATRSKPVRFMEWEQINRIRHEWNIPLENDKTKKQNANRTIYLSSAAWQLLKWVKVRDKVVFTTVNCKVLSDSIFGKIIRDLNEERKTAKLPLFVDENIINPETGLPSQITQHGTARATYRSWTASDENESKKYNVDAIELNLLHERKDPLRGAYDRSQHEAERKRIMEDWGNFCCSMLPKRFWEKE